MLKIFDKKNFLNAMEAGETGETRLPFQVYRNNALPALQNLIKISTSLSLTTLRQI